MNTLREMGQFVGMGPPISLRKIGNFVTSRGEQISMRTTIQRLESLPPISLEAEAVGDRFGDAPFTPVFHVHPSNGLILETRITLFQNGPQPDETAKVGDSGNFSPFELRFPGIYLIQVTRTGITNTGITRLEKNFHVEAVEPTPTSPPPPPPPPPQGGIKPTTTTQFSKVALFNCHSDHRTLDIRIRDLTLEQDYTLVTILDSQYDENGFCPGNGSTPIEITLTDKHWHEIVSLDSKMPGCINTFGDSMDPHNANCWREHIVVFGDKNGPVFKVIID